MNKKNVVGESMRELSHNELMKYMVGMIQPYLRGLHLSAVHYLQQ